MAHQCRLSRLRDAGGVWGGMCPLRSWSSFENIGLNEAIWCTIFRHVKHSTACLFGAFFTLEQDGQKSGGAMPPSLKSGGPLAPPPPWTPSSAAYGQTLTHFCFILTQCPTFWKITTNFRQTKLSLKILMHLSGKLNIFLKILSGSTRLYPIFSSLKQAPPFWKKKISPNSLVVSSCCTCPPPLIFKLY